MSSIEPGRWPPHPLWRMHAHAPLEQRHERLARTTYALWRIVKTRLDLSDHELIATLSEFSTETVAEPKLVACGLCHRPRQRSAKCCLYCGSRHERP